MMTQKEFAENYFEIFKGEPILSRPEVEELASVINPHENVLSSIVFVATLMDSDWDCGGITLAMPQSAYWRYRHDRQFRRAVKEMGA